MDSGVVVIIPLAMTLVTGLQWWLGTPPATLFFTSLAFLAGSIVYATVRIRGARKQIARLRLGRDGEMAVAEYLDTLGRDGVRALHDLLGDGFNIDHVAITPKGVLVIETKTISKPMDRDAQVVYDGTSVTVGGHVPERDPIIQARAAAAWVQRQLREALGRDYPVRAVVTYPGWFVVRPKGGPTPQVWVLETKEIGRFLEQEPTVLSDQDRSQIVYFLKRFVRAQRGSSRTSWPS